jgi:hypothetical protein
MAGRGAQNAQVAIRQYERRFCSTKAQPQTRLMSSTMAFGWEPETDAPAAFGVQTSRSGPSAEGSARLGDGRPAACRRPGPSKTKSHHRFP